MCWTTWGQFEKVWNHPQLVFCFGIEKKCKSKVYFLYYLMPWYSCICNWIQTIFWDSRFDAHSPSLFPDWCVLNGVYVCMMLKLEKQSPIMMIYMISGPSVTSCSLLSQSKGVFCLTGTTHALGWAVPVLLGQCVLVQSLFLVSTRSHDIMTSVTPPAEC